VKCRNHAGQRRQHRGQQEGQECQHQTARRDAGRNGQRHPDREEPSEQREIGRRREARQRETAGVIKQESGEDRQEQQRKINRRLASARLLRGIDEPEVAERIEGDEDREQDHRRDEPAQGIDGARSRADLDVRDGLHDPPIGL
jgi:hypothetical protein